ncbi:MAG: hypothetical protein IJB59_09500 [Oscillospiraceae bacterium]|nr:hypothetical protein [Oscillospiraceae bacterium]
MTLELFVDQPNLELKQGIQVRKDTKLSFQNETVEQLLQDLQLDTIMEESGTNGINSYKTKSHICIQLNEGDVLLFDPARGYYLPHYPKVTIRQAVEDIRSLESFARGAEEDT